LPPARETPGLSILRAPRSNDVYFMFTGLRQRVAGMPPVEFLTDTGLIERNVIGFRDRRGAFYTRGVSLDLPHLDSIATWSRGFIDGLSPTVRSFCIGNSSGAFAAISIGHRLGVNAVWAFGLPTLLPAPIRDSEHLNLRNVLSHSNGITQYFLHYCNGCKRDRDIAESLADLPGVEIRPFDCSGHRVIYWLFEKGELARMFPPSAQVDEPMPHGTSSGKRERITVEQVLELLRQFESLSGCDLTADFPIGDLLDSFAVVTLLSNIESTFEVRVTAATLDRRDLSTPAALAACLNRDRG